MINKRFNDLSCNKEKFDKAKQSYCQALKASGFDGKLNMKRESHSREQENAK